MFKFTAWTSWTEYNNYFNSSITICSVNIVTIHTHYLYNLHSPQPKKKYNVSSYALKCFLHFWTTSNQQPTSSWAPPVNSDTSLESLHKNNKAAYLDYKRYWKSCSYKCTQRLMFTQRSSLWVISKNVLKIFSSSSYFIFLTLTHK